MKKIHHWVGGIVLFTLCHSLAGQVHPLDSMDVNLCISTSDNLTAGSRYPFGQNQVGINAGYGIAYNDASLVINVSYYRHLFGRSAYSSLRPWYIKPAVSYWQSCPSRNSDRSPTRTLELRCFFGREFNINPRAGLSVSAGLTRPVYQKNNPNTSKEYPYFFGAGFDAMVFYKLKKQARKIYQNN